MKPDRDNAIDWLLRETPAAFGGNRGSDTCLDAETLAAWMDGRLDRRERTAIEAHAASCARCQAALAAMVRTQSPAPARSPRRLLALMWIAPVTAVAAAAIVFAILPARRASMPPADAGLEVRRAAATPPDTQPPPAPAQSPAASAQSRAPVAEPPKNAAPPPPPAASVARQAFAPTPSTRAAGDRRGTDALSDRTAPGASSAPPAALAGTAAPAPAPTPSTVAESTAFDAKAAAAGQAGAPMAAPRNAPFARAATAPARDASIVPPGGTSRWRIAAAGAVEHSVDSGVTWQTQQTGVEVTLTAGASPSASVCWIVGRGGTVVVSTDGRTWQRVPFPESVDLVNVTATDGRSAVVTTATGQRFATTDGGATWSRAP